MEDLPLAVDGPGPWLGPKFRDEEGTIGEELDGADLVLLPLVGEHRLVGRAFDFGNPAFGVFLAGIDGQQDIAIGERFRAVWLDPQTFTTGPDS